MIFKSDTYFLLTVTSVLVVSQLRYTITQVLFLFISSIQVKEPSMCCVSGNTLSRSVEPAGLCHDHSGGRWPVSH